MENGRLRINCSCPRFADVGRCKHLAAAMIAFLSGPPRERVPGSDRYARQMLQRYLQITQEPAEPSQKPIRLCALLRDGYGTEYPSFSLRVGYDRAVQRTEYPGVSGQCEPAPDSRLRKRTDAGA